ncbi:hypothetical protein CBM2633_P50008 [Cupriavidus taiwanensis]|uniref:Uncharacterized protein n=2 Tax=Cupriavidus TaxID=106589 RepID=A0A375CPR3_9BURK|nr:hypothetical protein CBM2588_P60008 [Cupriavidus taiwanensis]SOZ40746.1 hypothetical protein CBM2605_P50008 [Cupriavidus neocaledonicus]SOY76799.1 hypothetical protein CBM2585_P50008 [Cupriavidus taiwanensis]SOY76808.1 hypothetical protein CBM2592_P70008 [Cupriavidus taiwanensis]SOY77201.1 hypothetical protein CBM2589_P50008 [Cupriavidus taiwanensis]
MPSGDVGNMGECPGRDSSDGSRHMYRQFAFYTLTQHSASSRHDSRQEPYAVALHVRICAGGGG